MAEPTAAPDSAVARCLDIDLAQFEVRHWGHEPRMSRTAGFSDLFDATAADELLAVRGLRTPFLRMARGGAIVPASQYTSSGGAGARIGDQADPTKVFAQMAAGATLVLQALHRVWPPLRRFAADLSRDLGHPVQVNAYITPPQSQGFAAHYDTHDVFVLQVSGTKKWRVHRPVVEHPLPGQEWEKHRDLVSERAAQEPFLVAELSPGDALYLPRGWLHSAATGDGMAIHLTVGIHTLTGRDISRAVLEMTGDDPELRRNLPIGAGRSTTALAAMVEPILKDLSSAVDAVGPSEVAQALSQRFDEDAPPESIGVLAQLTADPTDVAVRLRTGVRATVTTAHGRVRLAAGAHVVEAPERFEPAVRALVAGGVLSASPTAGSLDLTELIRRLLLESLVVPVE